MTIIHQIIFFDNNKNNIETYKKKLSDIPNLSFVYADFEDLINENNIHITISPANSYLSMTGGIDKTYSKLFPGIESSLRKQMIIKKYEKGNIRYFSTKYILPIGKAIIAPTNNSKCPFIMASPTMKTPKDINETDNVYRCMCAILEKINKINLPITIACPCLGTGIGNLSAIESADQIRRTFAKYIKVQS